MRLNCMNHFNQASLMPLNLGQPLMIRCGPPECWAHLFRAAGFSWSSRLCPSAQLSDDVVIAELLCLLWLGVASPEATSLNFHHCSLLSPRDPGRLFVSTATGARLQKRSWSWKHCIRGLPYDSSKPARVGTHLCTARNYWLLQVRAGISHFIIFVPKISLSRGALLQLWY